MIQNLQIIIQDIPGHIPAEEDYIYFDGPWTSIVKTITMFVGELEFSDIPIDPDSKISWFSFSFLVVFVFFIVVILMNLLNGLAVSDTGMIMEKAEIVSHTTRVETISYMESVLLGDPFEFLSRWPPVRFVSGLPSLALCHQVYSSCPTARRAGHCITGATGILLFYRSAVVTSTRIMIIFDGLCSCKLFHKIKIKLYLLKAFRNLSSLLKSCSES